MKDLMGFLKEVIVGKDMVYGTAICSDNTYADNYAWLEHSPSKYPIFTFYIDSKNRDRFYEHNTKVKEYFDETTLRNKISESYLNFQRKMIQEKLS